jgi:hypothetical protein
MPEEKTVLDAVNEALGTPAGESDAITIQEDAEPADMDGTAGDQPTDTDQTDDAEGTGEPEDGGEPEGEGEPEKGPNGERERNPDGTWKKSEAKAEPKVDEKKEPPKKDPINDPIPKDLKKETSERIRTLIDTAKTTTAERDEIKQNFDYMVNGIQATGASPEQYGETLSWLALFNSRDPVQQEKALELVESVAERLATLLGKERVVGDSLAAHADLKEAVRTGKLTAEYAKEIARTRNGQQFRTELTTSATQAEQQRQQAANEEHNGRTALTELENTLRATDPDYEAKKAILVPTLKATMASVPWLQKAAKFQEAYRSLNLPKAAAPVKPRMPVNQPLRAKQPSGGGVKQPSSALDAMGAALANMPK